MPRLKLMWMAAPRLAWDDALGQTLGGAVRFTAQG
jgi:hypothetical protein